MTFQKLDLFPSSEIANLNHSDKVKVKISLLQAMEAHRVGRG
jgi:hypothetical protein